MSWLRSVDRLSKGHMVVGAKMREDRRARLRRYLEQIGIRWRRAPDQSCIVGLQQAADLGFGRVSAEHDDDIGRRRQGRRAERLVGFLAERHESARAADDRELQRREDGDGPRRTRDSRFDANGQA